MIIRPRGTATHARCGRPGDQHLAGLQLRRRERRRLGRQWYVSDAIPSVDLDRPFLGFGVPFRFRDWDLNFIAWLNRTGKHVEFLSDDDLERRSRAATTWRAPTTSSSSPGHEEYMTAHAYDVVERYRDLGGNLMFLAANNFFWKVRAEGTAADAGRPVARHGRPEAALVGVQYVGSNHGAAAGAVHGGRAPRRRRGRSPAPGSCDGTRSGRYGIEIDARTAASPPGIQVLAADPGPDGAGQDRGDDVLRDPGRREGLRRGRDQLRRVGRSAGRLAAAGEPLGTA